LLAGAGTLVPVNAMAMAQDVFFVVLIPTIVGVLANEFLNPLVAKIRPLLPLIGVFITTMLCASPVGQVAEILKANGLQLCLPVALLHLCAFILGYFLCKVFNYNEKTARTVRIKGRDRGRRVRERVGCSKLRESALSAPQSCSASLPT